MDIILNQKEPRLEVSFSSKNNLYNAYIPFIKPLGLFIVGSFPFKLGEKVNLCLNLLFARKKAYIEGKVVWMIPKNAHHQQAEGIGIQFELPQNKLNDQKIITELLQLFFKKGEQCNYEAY